MLDYCGHYVEAEGSAVTAALLRLCYHRDLAD